MSSDEYQFPASTPLLSQKNRLLALGVAVIICPLIGYGLIYLFTKDSTFSSLGIMFGLILPIGIFIKSVRTKSVGLTIGDESLSLMVEGETFILGRNEIKRIKTRGSKMRGTNTDALKILTAIIITTHGKKVMITDFSTVNSNAAVEALANWWHSND